MTGKVSAADAIINGLGLTKEGESLKAFEEFINAQPKGKRINPKKVQAFARRIAPLCAPHIVNGLIRGVLSTKDPVGYLRGCFREINEYAVIIRDFVESGHHGMLQIGKNCYPVKLKCPVSWLSEDAPWHPEDERLIGADACNAWMRDNDVGYFHGRVVLFSDFGFTGIPREFELRCSPNTQGMERYPGTRYFFAKK